MTDRATIDWLPPEPLTITTCKEYQRTDDHGAECGPLIGREPTPKTTVVGCDAGIDDRALYTAFEPDAEAWVAIEAGEISDVIHHLPRVGEELMGFRRSNKPDATFALLQQVGVDPKTN